MQGGGGDPFDSGYPFGGFGGSFGGSGVPSYGPPSSMTSFGGDSFDGFDGRNNGPPTQMSDVFGRDSIDDFGRSSGGPPNHMSNVFGGDSADGFGRPNGGPLGQMSNVLGGDLDDDFGDLPSLPSNFSGGRDPFDDPFFTEPFGGSMLQPSLFGPPTMDPFEEMSPPPLGFIENHHQQPPQPTLPGGQEIIVIDDEEEEGEVHQETRVILGKHGRSSSEVEIEEAIAEERRIAHMQNRNANALVDNEQWQQQTQERRITQMQNMNANTMVNNGQWQPQTQERRITHLQNMNENDMMNNGHWQPQWQPQTQGYSFQSSNFTYGAHDGNYYTSSRTRRTGSDGLTLEESREGNTATLEAAHRVSRGFHNRGHTVERTRNSDGRVDTNQTLHNLNEDELAGFEQSWGSNAGMQTRFPGQSGSFGSGFVNPEQSMFVPQTDPSSSRARGEPYRRRNATDSSRLGF